MKHGLEHLVKSEKRRVLNFNSINQVESFGNLRKHKEGVLCDLRSKEQAKQHEEERKENFFQDHSLFSIEQCKQKALTWYSKCSAPVPLVTAVTTGKQGTSTTFVNSALAQNAHAITHFLNQKFQKVNKLFAFLTWRFHYVKLVDCKITLQRCKVSANFSIKNRYYSDFHKRNNVIKSHFIPSGQPKLCATKVQKRNSTLFSNLAPNNLNPFIEVASPFFDHFLQVTRKAYLRKSLGSLKKFRSHKKTGRINFITNGPTLLEAQKNWLNKKDVPKRTNPLGSLSSMQSSFCTSYAPSCFAFGEKQETKAQMLLVESKTFNQSTNKMQHIVQHSSYHPFSKNTFGLGQSDANNEYPYKVDNLSPFLSNKLNKLENGSVKSVQSKIAMISKKFNSLTENADLLNQTNGSTVAKRRGYKKRRNNMLCFAPSEHNLGSSIFDTQPTVQEKYNKFHTLPIFSTLIYKEWSHRFSFLEYFVWSARKNDLILPFYINRGACHTARLDSINLLKNQIGLFTSANRKPSQLSCTEGAQGSFSRIQTLHLPCSLKSLQPVQPLVAQVAQRFDQRSCIPLLSPSLPSSALLAPLTEGHKAQLWGKVQKDASTEIEYLKEDHKQEKACFARGTAQARRGTEDVKPFIFSFNGCTKKNHRCKETEKLLLHWNTSIPRSQVEKLYFVELRNKNYVNNLAHLPKKDEPSRMGDKSLNFSRELNRLTKRSSLQPCASPFTLSFSNFVDATVQSKNVQQKSLAEKTVDANIEQNSVSSNKILPVVRQTENIFEWRSCIFCAPNDPKVAPSAQKNQPSETVSTKNFNYCKPNSVSLKYFEKPLYGPNTKKMFVGVNDSLAYSSNKPGKAIAKITRLSLINEVCDKNLTSTSLLGTQDGEISLSGTDKKEHVSYNGVANNLWSKHKEDWKEEAQTDLVTQVDNITWGKIDDTQQFPRLAELLHLTGGTALRHLLSRFHLILLGKFLRNELKSLELKVNFLLALKMLSYSQGLLLGKLAKRRSKQIRRLKLLELFQSKKSNPEWMILSILPVLPPDLRPILRVNDDFVVASDLNRLYQTVLRRNNTIHERLDDPLPCPESGLFRQRSLQKAVDGLLENGKGGGTPLCASKRRPLVSLSHVLKGKKGLFRQHLLGKRVDYSGRSVIVVGPKLKLHECGLPKEMALELFQPFLIHKLKIKGLATSNTTARRMIQQEDPIIWHTVQQLVYEHPVLLNRAPTLHRLGIQAFQPRLVSGRAILLHPLVCNGFNADFDGDQMAVHIPLSFQARAEAWKIMWSKNNLLSPATGQPILVPSQDMVLGCYYLSVNIPRSCNLPYSKKNLLVNGVDNDLWSKHKDGAQHALTEICAYDACFASKKEDCNDLVKRRGSHKHEGIDKTTKKYSSTLTNIAPERIDCTNSLDKLNSSHSSFYTFFTTFSYAVQSTIGKQMQSAKQAKSVEKSKKQLKLSMKVQKTNPPGYFKKTQHIGFLTDANLLQRKVTMEMLQKKDDNIFFPLTPLFAHSTQKLKEIHLTVNHKTPVIGSSTELVFASFVFLRSKHNQMCTEGASKKRSLKKKNGIFAFFKTKHFNKRSGINVNANVEIIEKSSAPLEQDQRLYIKDVSASTMEPKGQLQLLSSLFLSLKIPHFLGGQNFDNSSHWQKPKHNIFKNTLTTKIGLLCLSLAHDLRSKHAKQDLWSKNAVPLAPVPLRGMGHRGMPEETCKTNNVIACVSSVLTESVACHKEGVLCDLRSKEQAKQHTQSSSFDQQNWSLGATAKISYGEKIHKKIEQTFNSVYRLERGHYFSTLQDSLVAYYQGRLETHTPFWVRLDTFILDRKKETDLSHVSCTFGCASSVPLVTFGLHEAHKRGEQKQYSAVIQSLSLPLQPLQPKVFASLITKGDHAEGAQQMHKVVQVEQAQGLNNTQQIIKRKSWPKKITQHNTRLVHVQQPQQKVIICDSRADERKKLVTKKINLKKTQVSSLVVQNPLLLQPRYGRSKQLSKVLFQENHHSVVIEGNDTLETPLELRLGSDGHLVQIFTACQNDYSFNATFLDQCIEKSSRYICTTAGRIVINDKVMNLLNKNVF